MRVRVGVVAALMRYPVKSMRGEPLRDVAVGWHGLAGDRRLALRRCDDRAGFPWLTASRLPDLVRYRPTRDGAAAPGALPTHVRTPAGVLHPVFDPALAAELSARSGSPLEMVHLDRGVFDEASVSLIASDTVAALCGDAGLPADARRFRPNVVVAGDGAAAFAEDAWVGGVLAFGDAPDAAEVAVTNHDVRCMMVTLDPDTAAASPALLRAIVRTRDNRAGVYGTVLRGGRLRVGDPVWYTPRRAPPP